VIERPDGAVRETLVIVAQVRLGERDGHEPGAVEVEGFEIEVRLPAPSDPGTVHAAHHLLEGGDEPSWRCAPRGLTVGTLDTVYREAVSDNDEFGLRHLYTLLLCPSA
jgi:hypothetical protein